MPTLGSPCASYQNYIPLVEPIGDSITEGDWSTVLAGWREPVYLSAQSAGAPKAFRFVGSLSTNPGGLTADPYHDGHPSWAIRNSSGVTGALIDNTAGWITQFAPDMLILAAGTNDIGLLSDSGATVAASLSSWLDVCWNARVKGHMQIAVCTILKRLDASDAQVQAANALFAGVLAGKSYSSHLHLVDMYASITNPSVGVNMHDAIHPNDAGYTLMGSAMWADSGFQAALLAARPS